MYNLTNIYVCAIILINCFCNGPINNFLVSPLIIVVSIYFLICKNKYSYSVLKKSTIYLPEAKYLFLFILWCLISFVINLAVGEATILRFVIGGIGGYFLAFVLSYFIGLMSPFYINSRILVKVIIGVLYSIMAFGLIEFILCHFNISIINFVISFFSGRSADMIMGYKSSELTKIQSFFAEPSIYGWFLVCNIPLLLEISKSEYKVFHNNIINILIKKTVPLFILLSIIFIASPIFLIIAILIYLIYKIKVNKVSSKAIIQFTIILLLLLLSILTVIFYQASISNNPLTVFLVRIFSVYEVLGDWDKFVIVEPSLATRIASYINMFCIFLKHPLLGVSCGHLVSTFIAQLQHTPVTLTRELFAKFFAKDIALNTAVFFKVIAETGIVGIILLFNILNACYIRAKKLSIFQIGIMSDFSKGVSFTVLAYIALIFYNSILYCHYFWFLFGTISGIYLKQKINQRKLVKNDGCFDNIS